MKKIFTLLLVILGCVGQMMAWDDDVYLYSSIDSWNNNAGVNYTNSPYANKFTRWGENDFSLTIDRATITANGANGIWFSVVFHAHNTNGDMVYVRPNTDNDWDVSTTKSVTTKTGYQKAFHIDLDANTEKIQIYAHWFKEDNTDKWAITAAKIAGTYDVVFNNSDKWSSVHFYAYQNDHLFLGVWPGLEVTASDDGLYRGTIPACASSLVIFDQESGVQTGNLPLVYDANYDASGITSVTATIGSEGYATFSSTQSVNFTGVDGLTAQKGKVKSNGFIEWTTAGKLLAGEGVLLSGNPGTYTINIVDDAVADANNEFKAIDTKQKLPQSGGEDITNYILAHPAGKTLGFYKVNTSGSWCKAGTAYISSSNGPAAAREFIPIWEEDPTGVDEVLKTENLENGTYYNLAGQQIAKPSRGLYIVNGKKVIR